MSQMIVTLDPRERARRLRRVYSLLSKLASESEASPDEPSPGDGVVKDAQQQPQGHCIPNIGGREK